MSTSPNTVTEAVNLLAEEGYTTDLGLREDSPHAGHGSRQLIIEKVFRFEGDSDPADEAIVIGAFCPECASRGTVVSAYGHDADPDLLAQLSRHPVI